MRLLFALALGCAGAALCALNGGPATALAQDPTKSDKTAKADKPAVKPVPVNMHDFMEGVFQSPYKRLKTAMAAEPKDAAG
ncbi:MAG: hypothetical protein K2V38_05000, partial [Gemmataceae bacterium]|nr:hypothetical protein [Gemmataceae bacterium]